MNKDQNKDTDNKCILVIGGAGYIGSHMVRTLLEQGHSPIVFDNLSTGHEEFIPKDIVFIKGDLCKEKSIQAVFKKYPVDTVMHFAASALVSESMSNPLKYYYNNVSACINLIRAMLAYRIQRLIFSSTCSVYGEPERMPLREDSETNPINPYGRSKLMIENILRDTSEAYDFSYSSLRYFNVAGAHSSGEIGEKHDPETHLIPSILKVVKGEKKELIIFGDDYSTPDNTCIRDFIHVDDLCQAHLLALEALRRKSKSDIFNLGNGAGYSIREVLKTVEEVTGREVKVKIGPRRTGDPARLIASYEKAKKILGWQPKADLKQIIDSAWEWEKSY
jgi:UDP-glucose 4-epimerase